MISTLLFQEAIVEALQTDADLSGTVGEEVRESDYQATNFVYPNVRVDRPNIMPAEGSDCTNKVTFTVYVNSKQPSSQECLRLFDLVVGALEGRKIETTFVRSTDLVYRGCVPAYRASVDSWRADIFFSTQAVKP